MDQRIGARSPGKVAAAKENLLNARAFNAGTIQPSALRRPTPDRSVVGIGKSYGARALLQDLSIEVSQGGAVAFLGSNGVSKRICYYENIGTVVVDHGWILLQTSDVTDPPMPDRALLGLAHLPQEASIFHL